MGVVTAMAVAGAGLGGYSAYAAGQAASDAADAQSALSKYNAQVNEQTARAIEIKTRYDQLRFEKFAEKTMGTLTAGLSASGVVLSEGAPLSLLIEQASELALESAMIGYEGVVRAGQARSQAGLSRYQGDVYQARARQEGRAGVINAGASLLNSATTMAKEGMFKGWF